MKSRKGAGKRAEEEESEEGRAIGSRIAKFTFHAYEKEKVSWANYVSQFKRACRVKNLGGEDIQEQNARRDLLLAYVGAEPLREIENHFLPGSVDDCAWEELLKECDKLFKPQTTLFAARIVFERSNREEGEACRVYANRLRELSLQCDYGRNWDERMRDRFAAGVKFSRFEVELRQRWPEGTTDKGERVTFNQLVELACSMERAQTEVTEPGASQPIEWVHRTEKVEKRQYDKACSACGRMVHGFRGCIAVKAYCHRCGKQGHLKRCCSQGFRRGAVRTLGADREPNVEQAWEEGACVQVVKSVQGRAPRAAIQVKLNGVPCEMEFDSGARVSTISKDLWIKIGCPKLVPVKEAILGYGKRPLKKKGKTYVEVVLREEKLNLPVVVMDEQDVPLFGLPWCIAFGMELPTAVEIYSVLTETQENAEELRHTLVIHSK